MVLLTQEKVYKKLNFQLDKAKIPEPDDVRITVQIFIYFKSKLIVIWIYSFLRYRQR